MLKKKKQRGAQSCSCAFNFYIFFMTFAYLNCQSLVKIKWKTFSYKFLLFFVFLFYLQLLTFFSVSFFVIKCEYNFTFLVPKKSVTHHSTLLRKHCLSFMFLQFKLKGISNYIFSSIYTKWSQKYHRLQFSF